MRKAPESSGIERRFGSGSGTPNLLTTLPHPNTHPSNWETPRLSDTQVRYAALDAIAGREIYLELLRQRRVPSDDALERLMAQWLLSGDEVDLRKARSLAMERDILRQLYTQGTGQSCFQRFPPIVKEGEGGVEAEARVRAQRESVMARLETLEAAEALVEAAKAGVDGGWEGREGDEEVEEEEEFEEYEEGGTKLLVVKARRWVEEEQLWGGQAGRRKRR